MPRKKPSTRDQIAANAAAAGLIKPAANGKPPHLPTRLNWSSAASRMKALNEREVAINTKTKAKKRLVVEVRMDLYERVIDLAERYGEDIAAVTRGSLLFGVEYFEKFGGERSPFTIGHVTLAAPSHLDAEGTRFPPHPGHAAPFVRPQPGQASFSPPPGRETVLETVEPVFRREQIVRIGKTSMPLEAALPSGGGEPDPEPPGAHDAAPQELSDEPLAGYPLE